MVIKVLLVGHEDAIAVVLTVHLEGERYDVSRALTAVEAVEHIGLDPPEVVLLSLDLPDMNGLDACQRLRLCGYRGGMIIVTSRASELDRVVGLDAGADDYVVEPFSLAELQARIRALVRRNAWNRVENTAAVTTPHGLHVDIASRKVQCRGVTIWLTPKEFDLLTVLTRHVDEVVPRGTLMDEVWGDNWTGSDNILDVTVGHVRKKLQGGGVLERITAVHGVGYRLGS